MAKTELRFACRHGEESEYCDKIRNQAIEYLEQDFYAIGASDYDLVSMLVAMIGRVEIFGDQWYAIHTDEYAVKCDSLVDGLASIFLAEHGDSTVDKAVKK